MIVVIALSSIYILCLPGCLPVCLFKAVCLYPINVNRTDRTQTLSGISRDLGEGLWMIEFSTIAYIQIRFLRKHAKFFCLFYNVYK